MVNIGDIVLNVQLNMQQFSQAMNNLRTQINTQTEDMGNAFRKLEPNIAALTGAITGLGVSMAGLVIHTADSLENIDKMSQKIGMSRQSFQEWNFIMKQNGGSMDSFKFGMRALVMEMDKAAKGNKEAINIFSQLHVAYQNTDGSLRNQDDVLADVTRSMQGFAADATKARFANILLGRSGQELMPVFNQTAGSFDKSKQKAHELGIILSDETVKSGTEAAEQFKALQMQMNVLGMSIGIELIPAFKQLMTYVQDHMPQIRKVVQEFAQATITGFKAIADHARQLIPLLAGLFTAFTAFQTINFFANLVGAIAALSTPLGLALIGIGALTAAGVALYMNWERIKNSNTWQSIDTQVSSRVEHMKAAFSSAINTVNTFRASIASLDAKGPNVDIGSKKSLDFDIVEKVDLVHTQLAGLYKDVQYAVASINNAFDGVRTGINAFVAAIQAIPSKIRLSMMQVQSAVTDPLKNIASAMKETGANITRGLSDGISSQVSQLQRNTQNLGHSILTKMKIQLGIQSPSTVFHEIGKNITLGLGLGMQSGIPGLEAITTQITKSLINSTALRQLASQIKPSVIPTVGSDKFKGLDNETQGIVTGYDHMMQVIKYNEDSIQTYYQNESLDKLHGIFDEHSKIIGEGFDKISNQITDKNVSVKSIFDDMYRHYQDDGGYLQDSFNATEQSLKDQIEATKLINKDYNNQLSILGSSSKDFFKQQKQDRENYSKELKTQLSNELTDFKNYRKQVEATMAVDKTITNTGPDVLNYGNYFGKFLPVWKSGLQQIIDGVGNAAKDIHAKFMAGVMNENDIKAIFVREYLLQFNPLYAKAANALEDYKDRKAKIEAQIDNTEEYFWNRSMVRKLEDLAFDQRSSALQRSILGSNIQRETEQLKQLGDAQSQLRQGLQQLSRGTISSDNAKQLEDMNVGLLHIQNTMRNTPTHMKVNLKFPGDPEVLALIKEFSAKYKVPFELAVAIAEQESGARQYRSNGKVVGSGAGAIGAMQLMPGTAAGLNVNPYDTAGNVEGGVKYIRQQLDHFGGNVIKAIAAYNAGPGNVERAGGVPHIAETQNYVARVTEMYSKFRGGLASELNKQIESIITSEAPTKLGLPKLVPDISEAQGKIVKTIQENTGKISELWQKRAMDKLQYEQLSTKLSRDEEDIDDSGVESKDRSTKKELSLIDKKIAKLKELNAVIESNTAQSFENMQSMQDTAKGSMKTINDAYDSTANDISNTTQNFQSGIEGIGSAIGGALAGMLTGTMTWKDALKQIFSSILNAFSQMITSMLNMWMSSSFGGGGGGAGGGMGGIGSLFTGLISGLFGGFRASGGPVEPGKSYIVGEKGPEIFKPQGSGKIESNVEAQAQSKDLQLAVLYAPHISTSAKEEDIMPILMKHSKIFVGQVDQAIKQNHPIRRTIKSL